jgi:2-octaprenylphenol hydroxylase
LIDHYDVVVVGSGIVGATTALALAKKTSLKIAIIDAHPLVQNWDPLQYDFRVSAISLASERIFKKIAVWQNIQKKRSSPYTHMYVWEEKNNAKIEFDARDVKVSALGNIIEDRVMRTALTEALQAEPKITLFSPLKLTTMQQTSEGINLVTADGKTIFTKLLVGADGAHSWVRQQAKIDLQVQDYAHTAIVATVKTTEPHQSTAWQCFLKTGPLAFLPLSDPHTSSIVWSTLPEHATQLLAQDDESFKKNLAEAFNHQLGSIIDVDTRYHYPLQMRHARNYVLPRIALVGDAAHTLHPLAGQGVNLGLMDAACLVDVITEAFKKQRDFASFMTLRKYERWRKGDNLAMLKMVGFLKYLFMSDKTIIQSLRSMGLNFTDRTSFLKNFFAQHALGYRKDLPEFAS